MTPCVWFSDLNTVCRSNEIFLDTWGRGRWKTYSGLPVFYLCFVQGHWDVFPFSFLWASPAFSPKTPHDVSKPCISSIATIILQITCFMVLFSCREDSAPSALRSHSLWIHTTLIFFFFSHRRSRLHRRITSCLVEKGVSIMNVSLLMFKLSLCLTFCLSEAGVCNSWLKASLHHFWAKQDDSPPVHHIRSWKRVWGQPTGGVSSQLNVYPLSLEQSELLLWPLFHWGSCSYSHLTQKSEDGDHDFLWHSADSKQRSRRAYMIHQDTDRQKTECKILKKAQTHQTVVKHNTGQKLQSSVHIKVKVSKNVFT